MLKNLGNYIALGVYWPSKNSVRRWKVDKSSYVQLRMVCFVFPRLGPVVMLVTMPTRPQNDAIYLSICRWLVFSKRPGLGRSVQRTKLSTNLGNQVYSTWSPEVRTI